MIVAITGYAGSGKSTVARHLVERYGFERLAFGDPLKGMLLALGCSERELWGDLKETPSEPLCGRTPRHAMQTLGTEWGRELIHPDIWIAAWIRRACNAGPHVVADDLRFKNEALAVRKLGGVIWRVRRLGHEAGAHVSETEMDLIGAEKIIENNGGIDLLRHAVEGLVDDVAWMQINSANS